MHFGRMPQSRDEREQREKKSTFQIVGTCYHKPLSMFFICKTCLDTDVTTLCESLTTRFDFQPHAVHKRHFLAMACYRSEGTANPNEPRHAKANRHAAQTTECADDSICFANSHLREFIRRDDCHSTACLSVACFMHGCSPSICD
jgi:hypothetical protein